LITLHTDSNTRCLCDARDRGIVKGGVIIPLKPLIELEGKKVKIKIVDVESVDVEKLYSYLWLLRKGEEAQDFFEI
jgi:predicted DNA-binding antitoxin AbrB/MazE fold protein